MKKTRVLFFVLMFLPLAAVLAALPFLPDQIPAHYNFAGEVTRFGSRFELLLMPGTVLLSGGFILLTGVIAKSQEQNANSNNQKVILVCGVAMLVVFNLLFAVNLYTAFAGVTNLNAMPFDFGGLLFTALGLALVLVGNHLPKAKPNAIVGVRTKASRSSPEAWRKSQRVGGLCFTVTGLLLVVCNLFWLRGAAVYWVSLALLTAGILACLLGARLAARKTAEPNNK